MAFRSREMMRKIVKNMDGEKKLACRFEQQLDKCLRNTKVQFGNRVSEKGGNTNIGSSNKHVAGTGVMCSNLAVSANTNTHNGIRTLCSSAVLSTKKCVPCNTKDLRPMTEEAANQLMPQVSGWELVNDCGILKLHRSWKVKTFTKGLEFFQEVASVAEAEGHHPDLHLVGWNNVKIDIWTHSVGGLTENDFILAAKVNELDVQHLLSKKLSRPTQSNS